MLYTAKLVLFGLLQVAFTVEYITISSATFIEKRAFL